MKNYWYWGTIAQIKYHIGLSDKYLVEAKTLFEYKQYLLATDALQRSDTELSGLTTRMSEGSREGKDMSSQKSILSDAMEKHITVLKEMKKQLPDEFQWTPEKASATNLSIGLLLDTSIGLRQKLLSELHGSK
jgi:hypothetical protein